MGKFAPTLNDWETKSFALQELSPMTPCQGALSLDRAGEAQPLDPNIGSRFHRHQTTDATTDFRYIQAFGWPRWLIMAALWNRAGHYIFCPLVSSSFFLWPPYVIGGHYIFALWFLSIYLSIYLLLFSSPNLSGHRLDLYHTSTHGVAL